MITKSTCRRMTMDYPPVTVVIITYNRPNEIKATITALKKYLRYDGLLHWHIADDGSPAGYLDGIREAFPDICFTATVTERKGWGANVNAALQFVASDFVFMCEDDYVARKLLNINDGVSLLLALPTIGLVRYDGLAGHDLVLHLTEFQNNAGLTAYLSIEPSSRHLNIYSNRPHLKHRRFHECYGWYKEGLKLGETEEEFAHRVRNKIGGLGIAILTDGLERAFDHIGHSRQGTEYDV